MEEPEGAAGDSGGGGGGGGGEIWMGYLEMDDEDVDLDPAKFQIEEEMVAEVMKRLEEEITRPCGSGGGGVTINGNEESCGPSFSDWGASVMASIDTRVAAAGGELRPWFLGAKGEEEAAPPLCAGDGKESEDGV